MVTIKPFVMLSYCKCRSQVTGEVLEDSMGGVGVNLPLWSAMKTMVNNPHI